MKEKLWGVYSEKQKAYYGEFVYSTPSGVNVIVTEVSTLQGCPNNKWDDKVDMGEVEKFISRESYEKFGGALR